MYQFQMSGFQTTIQVNGEPQQKDAIAVYTDPGKPYEFFVPVHGTETPVQARRRVQKMLDYLNGFQGAYSEE